MSIDQIWKKYNVSTVMVLPLFWDITYNVFAKGTTTLYPFAQLCFEYGLLNTYLYRKGKFNKCLHLLFDKTLFSEDLELTNSKYHSMCELLVDSEYFKEIQVNEDTILVSLRIPFQFLPDIENFIMEGKYSKVTEDYKKEIKIKEASVPIGSNKLAIYMSINDLAYAISIKAKHVKQEIEDTLDIDIDLKSEFYEKFDKKKESIE